MNLKTLFLLLAFHANGVADVIIPLATTHIGGGEFNNKNYGLGIEYRDKYLYSITYLANNSYREQSVYLSISDNYNINQSVSLLYGGAIATGYKNVTGSGILIVPVFGIQYKQFRLVTTYPAAQLFCEDGIECGDFVNLQYIYKF